MRRISTKRAARLAESEPAIDALRLVVDRCEFCQRPHLKLSEHHVAQGSNRGLSLGETCLVLLLCSDCHNTLHRMAGDDVRALGLALLHFAGRLNLGRFYTVTGRRFPEPGVVDLWVDRLLRGAK